ncbi:MAG TPA: hypothetical protein VF021_11385 [Longimicrobiales bacterium]
MILRITAVLATSILLTAQAPRPPAAPVMEVTVTASDFTFDAPASVAAGVIKFTLVNKGPSIHHLMIVRLDGGHTLQDVMDNFGKGPAPDWFVMMGGPNAGNPGGGTSNATLVLEPGNYLLTCFVGSAKDPMPHIMKGMVKELTVTAGAPQKSALENADVIMTLADYSFTTSQDLKAGRHTFRVENNAQQPHEVELLQLAPGKTVQDLMKWLPTEDGPPPASLLGGVAPLSPGHANNFSADLGKGDYVLLCFVPDAKDGAPHFVHGMVRAFSIE